MRPSFLLTPDAFTRGEGVGVPIVLNGTWPHAVLDAVAHGTPIQAFDTVNDRPSSLPRAVLLSGRLNGERLDRFIASTPSALPQAPVPLRSWGRPS